LDIYFFFVSELKIQNALQWGISPSNYFQILLNYILVILLASELFVHLKMKRLVK